LTGAGELQSIADQTLIALLREIPGVTMLTADVSAYQRQCVKRPPQTGIDRNGFVPDRVCKTSMTYRLVKMRQRHRSGQGSSIPPDRAIAHSALQVFLGCNAEKSAGFWYKAHTG
jgi:hypothetical protein